MEKFRKSAREFRNVRSIVGAALLIALHTVFACFVSIQVTNSLRISISFIINVAIGAMYGPVMGFVCGGVGDIVQFLIKPTGPYFIGWTISAALAGLIYGLFFYDKMPGEIMPKPLNLKTDRIVKMISCALPVACVLVWLLCPVFNIEATNYTGFTIFEKLGFSDKGINASIVSLIILIMAAAVIILSIFDKFKTAFLVGVIGVFAAILAVYTDKKTITALAGFWIAIGIMICCLVVLMYAVSLKHTFDLKFLGLCVLTLTVDTILINILLGTYWVTVMYGKGFAFYFTSRLVKNLVQLPINIMLTYYFLGVIKRIKTRIM